MESTLVDIDREDELDGVTYRYVGPSVFRIADFMTRTVRYGQGWFWTTTAFCHGGDSEDLAFRDRPDGNGIDVRCHTRSCSRDEVLAGLEAATGFAIRSAYVPAARPANRLAGLVQVLVQILVLWGTAVLLFTAALLFGLGFQAAILVWLSYCIGGLIVGLPLTRLAGRLTR